MFITVTLYWSPIKEYDNLILTAGIKLNIPYTLIFKISFHTIVNKMHLVNMQQIIAYFYETNAAYSIPNY